MINLLDNVKINKGKFVPNFLKGKVGTVQKINNSMVYIQIGKEIFKLHKDDITVVEKPSLSECKFYVYGNQKIQYGALGECIKIFKERLKENNNYLAIGIENSDNALDFYTNRGVSSDYLNNCNVFSLMFELKNAIKIIEKSL